MTREKDSSYLLIDEDPLMVLPTLAEIIGLNEAILLQQIHFLVRISRKNSKHIIEDRVWIYNSYPEWSEIFPFWSEKTIWRIIKNLEEMKLLDSRIFQAGGTKWYTINYVTLGQLGSETPSQSGRPPRNVDETPSQDLPDPLVSLTSPNISDTTSDNTSENIGGSSTHIDLPKNPGGTLPGEERETPEEPSEGSEEVSSRLNSVANAEQEAIARGKAERERKLEKSLATPQDREEVKYSRSVREIERFFREKAHERKSEIMVTEWTGKEKKQASELMKKVGGNLPWAKSIIKYVMKHWETICQERKFKYTPIPNIGVILFLADIISGQAQLSEKQEEENSKKSKGWFDKHGFKG